MSAKTIILITGPTASGKTSLAIEVAKHYRTEIISADSRQCFTELNIGVAKPSPAELAAVPHHFINSHSIHDTVNAGTFADYADDVAQRLSEKHDVVVMAGGTGLYIKAFLEGFDDIPEINPVIRAAIFQGYELNGMGWLQNEVKVNDPQFFAEGEIQNPQRLMRALEVKLGTGRSIKEFHRKSHSDNKIISNDKTKIDSSSDVKTNSDSALSFKIKKYAIDIPREQLYQNINSRVETMIEDGLVEEAMELQTYRHLNALQTVGYSELFDHFDGKINLEFAVEKIKQNTRNYAKRQLTWLRKERNLVWINSAEQVIHQ